MRKYTFKSSSGEIKDEMLSLNFVLHFVVVAHTLTFSQWLHMINTIR